MNHIEYEVRVLEIDVDKIKKEIRRNKRYFSRGCLSKKICL